MDPCVKGKSDVHICDTGPLITKRLDVLSPNPVKSRSHEFGCYQDRIVLKSGRHLGSTASDVPVKYKSDGKSLNPNLAAFETLRDLAVRRPLSE